MKLPHLAPELIAPGAHIGQPRARVDGRAKVTGAAAYAAEHPVAGLLHGCVVSSAITRGEITRLDTTAALQVPGVVRVFSHLDRPRLARLNRKWKDMDSPKGEPFRPLHDAKISHAMQPVALVVAETLEAARAAAKLLDIAYQVAPHQTDLEVARAEAFDAGREKLAFTPPPKPRGDADAALAAAEVAIDVEYRQAQESHQPLELFATTVIYDDGDLAIYDKTQGVQNTQTYVCNVFGLPAKRVRVLAPYVGGAFGSGLRPQYQLFFAVLAATELERSVRVELTRPQMFAIGHRPEAIQRIALGARRDGALTALIHEVLHPTSQFETYAEVVVNWSTLLYQTETARQAHQLARVDTFTPLDMRAPGAATGVAALECAVDELAYALDMDPIALRLRNYTERDPNGDKPFSSKQLRACLEQGAARFGWAQRPRAARATKRGSTLVGTGMAVAAWDALQLIADARATLTADGKLVVASASGDVGTGTYTVMTQIAADVLGLAMDDVRFELGDSSLPTAPLQGGSWTVTTVGSAVVLACDAVGAELAKLAAAHGPAGLAGAAREELAFVDGCVVRAADPAQRIEVGELMRRAGVERIEREMKCAPDPGHRLKHTFATHAAVFAEVHVDEDTGMVRVARVVSAIAAGRIINPRMARSQIIGGIVGGIGQALYEEVMVDHVLGRCVNHDLAGYHLATQADVGELEVLFVEERDDLVNALGAKGVGEIGLIGVAAAVANAVFHATGVRVRRFPITLDRLV